MKMAEELVNIGTTEESDDLEDLIDENTIYYWDELQEVINEMDTESLIKTMVGLELFVNKTLALEISKRDNAVFHLRKIIQDGDYWGDDGFGKDGRPFILFLYSRLSRIRKLYSFCSMFSGIAGMKSQTG